jgi:hypothetical protein
LKLQNNVPVHMKRDQQNRGKSWKKNPIWVTGGEISSSLKCM